VTATLRWLARLLAMTKAKKKDPPAQPARRDELSEWVENPHKVLASGNFASPFSFGSWVKKMKIRRCCMQYDDMTQGLTRAMWFRTE